MKLQVIKLFTQHKVHIHANPTNPAVLWYIVNGCNILARQQKGVTPLESFGRWVDNIKRDLKRFKL